MSDGDIEDKEAKVRAALRAQLELAIKLRSKDREFHGLEREFRYHQARLTQEHEESRDVKHPRDVGDVREQILRRFLADAGYIPKRYAVSDRSVRVASSSGHLSPEIDIAFYDPLDSVTLMSRQDIYQVLPAESVYGVIQVKSKLTKAELKKGLDNLAAYKRLDRLPTPRPTGFVTHDPEVSRRGFGVLFAYESDLTWAQLVKEITAYAKAAPNREWANVICVLNKGHFLHGCPDFGSCLNPYLEAVTDLQLYGVPDREGIGLYQLIDMLHGMLSSTRVQAAKLSPYYRLPLVADAHSYAFRLGPFAEVGRCETHGEFTRKIPPDKVEVLTEWCRTHEPENVVKVAHLTYGMPEDPAAYERQPFGVQVYNPAGLPYSKILAFGPDMGSRAGTVSFDIIDVVGQTIYIPYHYAATEKIFSDCPKCTPPPKKPRRRRKAG